MRRSIACYLYGQTAPNLPFLVITYGCVEDFGDFKVKAGSTSMLSARVFSQLLQYE